MRPYEDLPTSVDFKGQTYDLDLSYGAFFAVADVLKDDRLMYGQKVATALDIFVPGDHPADPELLQAIYDLLKDDRPRFDGPVYMDIEQDWPFICAGFMQAYGIDLYADKSIHILRWQALLQGLPKSTKLMDVIGIRAAEIPKPTKDNGKQIAELARLKATYALKRDAKDFQTGLGGLFDLLMAQTRT